MVSMRKKYPIKTKYGIFSAAIWRDTRDNVYLAEVAAFNNAITQGGSIVEAKKMAADLIELLAEEALQEGKAIIDGNKRLYARGPAARQIGPVTIATA